MKDSLKKKPINNNNSLIASSAGSVSLTLANPRGFCAGVDRAIDIVNRALDVFGAPIYVRHEVVHNKYVVDRLRDRGAVFLEELHKCLMMWWLFSVPTAFLKPFEKKPI